MNRDFDNKITDIKKQEQYRRIDLAMLGKLIEMYPTEAERKVQKLKTPFKQMEALKIKKA